MAVVRQQELDGGFGQDAGEGAFDHIDDLGLTLGHVQRVGQTALEALALHLGIADHRLLVSCGDGIGELFVERPHAVVGVALLSLGDEGQDHGRRQDQSQEQAGRDEVTGESGGQGVASRHGRHQQDHEDHAGDDRARDSQEP